jgi:beta-mannosidase
VSTDQHPPLSVIPPKFHIVCTSMRFTHFLAAAIAAVAVAAHAGHQGQQGQQGQQQQQDNAAPVQIDLGGDDWSVVNGAGNVSMTAVTVPGDVHTSMLKKGLIDEPYYRQNELLYRWIPNDNWTYTKTFTPDASLKAQAAVELVFEGLDTICDVFLNGQKLGQAINQFRVWTYNVKKLLNYGEANTLTLVFASPVNWPAEVEANYPYTVPATPQMGLDHRQFIRKVQSDYGWDWGPAFAPIGVWRPVFLRGYSKPTVRHIVINQAHNADGSVDLNVTAFIKSPVPASDSLSLSVAGVSKTVSIAFSQAGWKAVSVVLHVEKPDLWWPSGYGKATRYDLTATLSGGSLTKKIGFREVLLIEEEYDDDDGKSYYFRVNGIPVFAKGANLIPFDAFPTRVTEFDYRMILGSAVEANMNMVRVWGGGMYQPDIFYDVADEYGIMIWQEFIFACAMYPRDEDFLKNVEIEVLQNVARLGYHPSIVIFGGNNENEAAFNWYPETRNNPMQYTVDYAKLYLDTVYPAMHSILYDRQWVHSSPSGGRISNEPLVYRFGALGDIKYGDKHFYDYSNDCTDVNHFPRARFVSEYGQQSWPSYRALEPLTISEDRGQESEFSLYRQRHPDGQPQLISQMEKHFVLTDETLGVSDKGYDNYLFLTQANQARCYISAITYWRRIRYEAPGKTMGVLYWQLNDIWQGPSWSSIEYNGRWKMLQNFVKKAYAPVIVSAQEYPYNNFSVYVTSDLLTPVSGNVQVDLYNWSGDKVKSVTQAISLPALGSEAFYVSARADFLESAKAEDSFAVLTLTGADGSGIVQSYFALSVAHMVFSDFHQ